MWRPINKPAFLCSNVPVSSHCSALSLNRCHAEERAERLLSYRLSKSVLYIFLAFLLRECANIGQRLAKAEVWPQTPLTLGNHDRISNYLWATIGDPTFWNTFVLLKMSAAGIPTHAVVSVSNLRVCSIAFPHLFCQCSQIPNSVLRKWPFIIRIYLKWDTTKTFPKQCRSGTRPHRKHNALQRRAKGQTLSPFFLSLLSESYLFY